MREADEARREAEAARQEAMAEAVEARREAFAERSREMREMRELPRRGEVRAALASARASITGAQGMRDADRKAALDSIDRALSGLDDGWSRGPTLR
ncbi:MULTISPECIES: hypothetical protein [unclassified Sphingomonas]|uniref:hypothetical protein n=1 Tax=unclassified Sphingomonas TaxID=196159 RepID=UPI0006FCD929|nr:MULTISPECIES: hypothetical protein [unclassified Sphingomonas]KQX21563.1 hypothetical protein ASD17_06300 [Sphingomonas sp. Root1294]KQY72880.1 hypothetical protein ASD39_00285 [Sphingomonas sp. Root50]KRB88327.1 hypothetical protein ASE22_23155 [Sphingomonas sp. Root720]